MILEKKNPQIAGSWLFVYIRGMNESLHGPPTHSPPKGQEKIGSKYAKIIFRSAHAAGQREVTLEGPAVWDGLLGAKEGLGRSPPWPIPEPLVGGKIWPQNW